VSFSVEGDYFEVCNCDVSCNCVWLGAATNDNCDVLLAWHVTRGSKDGVDLSGLNAVMAVHSPKRMTDGGWKVALYLDDRASTEQSQALGAVFFRGCWRLPRRIGPADRRGSRGTPGGDHVREVGRLAARRGRRCSFDEQRPAGRDGWPGACGDHERAVRRGTPQPVRQATAKDVSYHGHWSADFSGTNSFVTDFRYEG